MRLTIIIPARNAALHLGDQLEALAAQRVDHLAEVLVVDNGSSDGTVAVALAFEGRLPIRVIDGVAANGRSAVRNLGATHVRTEYVAFIDADDIVAENWLAELWGQVPAPVVAGYLARVPMDWTPSPNCSPAGRRPTYAGLETFGSANVMFESAIYRRLGGFNETYTHRVDTEFSIRLRLSGVPIVWAPSALVFYRQRASSAGHIKQQFCWGRASAQLARDYGKSIKIRHSNRNSLKHWLRLAITWPFAISSPHRRLEWITTAASLTGRLTGSIKHRVLYL
jgi:glycosyltransferase involved in cell wall biosynthesis